MKWGGPGIDLTNLEFLKRNPVTWTYKAEIPPSEQNQKTWREAAYI